MRDIIQWDHGLYIHINDFPLYFLYASRGYCISPRE